MQRSVDLLRHSPPLVARLEPLPELDSRGADGTSEPDASPTAKISSSPTAVEYEGPAVATATVPPTKEALARHRAFSHSFSNKEEVPASPFAAMQDGVQGFEK